MRILIPVDESDSYKAVFDCLQSLKLPGQEIDVMNVVPPLPSTDTTFTAVCAINTQEMVDAMHNAGKSELDRACSEAKGRGIACSPILAYGYPSSIIADTATEKKADLIAIGANPKGSLARLFGGSVTLNLAAGAEQSLLVVRAAHHPHGKVSAVFATDHSDYANRCLEKLLNWNPAGVSHVEVLTAYEAVGRETVRAGGTQAVSAEEVNKLAKEVLCEKSEAVAEKFRRAGIGADVTVVNSDIRTAIRNAMATCNADLLILGARGHGLWERILIGSTAMHQVAAEPYSMLILRA